MPPRVAPLLAAWLTGLPFVAAADIGLCDSLSFLPFHAWLLAGAALACLQAVLARRPPVLTIFDVALLIMAGACAARGMFTGDRLAGLSAGLALAALLLAPVSLGWFRESAEGRVWLWRLLLTQGVVAAAEWGVSRGVGVPSAGGLAPAVLLGAVAVAAGWRLGWPLGLAGLALAFALSSRAPGSLADLAGSIGPWGLGPGQDRDFFINHGLPADLPAPAWFQALLAGGWPAAALVVLAVAAWLACGRKAGKPPETAVDGAVPPPPWLAWAVQSGLAFALFARLVTADPDYRIAELAMGAARSLAAALALAMGRVGCPGPWTGRGALFAAGAAMLALPPMAHPGAMAMGLAAAAALPSGGRLPGVPGTLAGVVALALLSAGLLLGGAGVTVPAALAWRESAEARRRADMPANLDGKTLDQRRPQILGPLRRAARLDPERALWRVQLASRAETLFSLGLDWQRSAWLDEVRKEGLRHAMEAQRLRPRWPEACLAEIRLRMATGRWLAGRGFADQASGQFDAAARRAEALAELDPAGQTASGPYLVFQARLEGFESLGTVIADLRRLLAEQKRLRETAAAALAAGHDLSAAQLRELRAWAEDSH
ncbi:MAG: hypothetical protein FJ261_04975 [Planctomycetes bacterium]|nr:hypothetical protein [Planctomycetota bacterium]